MRAFPFDTVVFDMDGTLADTSPDLAAALNHTLRALGRPPVPQDLVPAMVGHGVRSLLRRGLAASGGAPEALVDRGFPLYVDYYADHICEGTTVYEGLEAALDVLAAEGVALAVCTNKIEALTHRLIEALGWRGRFAAVVGGDTLSERKPDAAPLREAIARGGGGRAVFVGDSITDAETARAAGIPFVAVSFGFSDRPVGELGADAVIDRYADLVEALRRL